MLLSFCSLVIFSPNCNVSEIWDNLHFPCFQWLEWSAVLNQTSAYFPDRLSRSPDRLISRLLNLNSYLPTSLTSTLLWWTRFPSVRSGFIDADADADADRRVWWRWFHWAAVSTAPKLFHSVKMINQNSIFPHPPFSTKQEFNINAPAMLRTMV